jgi:hypothetical protein
LRDSDENVPQPGFVGTDYVRKRILLVGQNPGIPNAALVNRDRIYTAALRRLRDDGSQESWVKLQEVLREFVPDWPLQRNYFPLEETDLTLSEIAYCNIVRCRTVANTRPSSNMKSECADNHFAHWLDLLEPRAIVFLGKWAYDRGSPYAIARQIPHDFMNRHRSLSSFERHENRERVVAFIRSLASK